MMTFARNLLAATFLLTASITFGKTNAKRKPAGLERPPQFVLLAFDGSKDLRFWDESNTFADTVSTINGSKKMRFTYFINPTYYTAPENRKAYNTPIIGPGVSCIGWSESASTIPPRIAKTNRAFLGGHEIASHANSHCDQSGADASNPMHGHPWQLADWEKEFEQFNYLLFSSLKINKIQAIDNPKFENGFSFEEKDIVGFRAPLLATTPDLFPALKQFNFRYDTSKTAAPDYWPQKQVWGGWNFPLAQIKIAGTTRKTLSMDYNWLYYHSAGVSKPDLTPEERQRWYQQMFDSYKYYFKTNYFGNRAPVQIGHHFSKWNQGAYWSAMKDFANFVCNKPEVRCVTFKEYADWLDGLDATTLEAYRKGQFEHYPDDNTIKDIAAPVLADVRLEFDAKSFDAVVPEEFRQRVKTLGWKTQLEVNFKPTADKISRTDLMNQVGKGKTTLIRANLINRSGVPVVWQTFRVKNLGQANEEIAGPLEDNTLKGEDADAHSGSEE